MLSRFGDVRGSTYRNVLVMKVDDVVAFLEALQSTLEKDASLANAVSRIVPITHGFTFSSAEEFESKSRGIVSEWVPELRGKRFHVRMHRRGFKGKLSSQHEEQFLDVFLLERVKVAGTAAAIDFDDPDVIIAVETLGHEAGLSRWTREQLQTYELLRLD
ncbi:MAG TPA: THUMP domain-containing protein [Gammaproteobacteria bacterium]|nr:THUMP domain-containing protein [Gammaproteobacteria bacterium]